MPFLTQLFLDAETMYREQMRDAYSLHRFVYSCFPKEDPEKRILYADQGPAGGGRKLLILSAREPEVPTGCQSATRVISDAFLSFDTYRFEVLLNPVRTENKTGKRIAVMGQLNLLNWFLARCGGWGIQPDTERLEVHSLPSLIIPRSGGVKGTFNRARYCGICSVTDRDLFKKSFCSGLGHGKAFGFGLLQVVPIPGNNNTTNI